MLFGKRLRLSITKTPGTKFSHSNYTTLNTISFSSDSLGRGTSFSKFWLTHLAVRCTQNFKIGKRYLRGCIYVIIMSRPITWKLYVSMSPSIEYVQGDDD